MKILALFTLLASLAAPSLALDPQTKRAINKIKRAEKSGKLNAKLVSSKGPATRAGSGHNSHCNLPVALDPTTNTVSGAYRAVVDR